MITTVTSASTLQSALSSAKAGDVIELASGNYGYMRITGQNFADDVTIRAASGAAPVFSGLSVNSSSGLTFQGLEFARTNDTNFELAHSQDIHFVGINVHGVLDGNTDTDPWGLYLFDNTNITVEDSEFHELNWGITQGKNDGLTILNNDFHDIRAQAVRGGGSSNVTVAGNDFRDIYPIGEDHPDAIQFWTTETTASAHDIVIANNTYVRGEGRISQGIFMRDEVGNLPYQRVTIANNLIVGANYHGIALGHATDAKIFDNVVVGFTDRKSWILIGDIDRVVASGNTANEYQLGVTTNFVNTNNGVIALASDDGAAAIAKFNARDPQQLASDKVLTGGIGQDSLQGGAGADTIVDTGGSNYLRGGDGSDSIVGGGAFDDINGNAGNDTVSGGSGADWVVGGRDNDSLSGGAGDDLIYGNLGADTCDGGDGADTLRGGQDDDLLLGGSGADYLSGDKGSDTMTGGAGADVFHSFGDAGLDRITDFNYQAGDRLRLDAGTSYTVSQVGSDVVVDMVGGGHVVLAGVSMSTLNSDWIFAG
ncbi:right-handed parallel beta-helix repeat-containing protein [Phenylobacterium sp.]|uniref:right-handed parallel beta-helix repeat-containing protein n=1 Tax=Phenylobacterium sp. TaxID=1871053 RepID=UPI0025FED239|nr:right-handed parallel beta-helix repeat-containing protein [Phenylobacterium sp.]